MLNDRVVPFFDEHDVPISRVPTDRGTEYCGTPGHHEYAVYRAIEDIDYTRTKARSPQTNGILDSRVQRGWWTPSGKMGLRQDPDADLP